MRVFQTVPLACLSRASSLLFIKCIWETSTSLWLTHVLGAGSNHEAMWPSRKERGQKEKLSGMNRGNWDLASIASCIMALGTTDSWAGKALAPKGDERMPTISSPYRYKHRSHKNNTNPASQQRRAVVPCARKFRQPSQLPLFSYCFFFSF